MGGVSGSARKQTDMTHSLIGVDEVGRGSLAGPLLVVAARAFLALPKEVADSKTLSRHKREQIFPALLQCCQFGEGWVSCKEIDKEGLAGAMRLGVARAFDNLQVDKSDQVILDGPVNYAPKTITSVKCIIDADAKIPLVSAASIYAKVTRDKYMVQLKDRYPHYGFNNHVGYGTRAHLGAIERYGYIDGVHRLSFRPLRLVKGGPT